MSNLEGKLVFGDKWQNINETHLYAYMGLLILDGAYKSRNEFVGSLWDKKKDRAIFHLTLSLKTFYYSLGKFALITVTYAQHFARVTKLQSLGMCVTCRWNDCPISLILSLKLLWTNGWSHSKSPILSVNIS